MNIRKHIDYSLMFNAMRVAMSADISQMNLYYELGRLICQRTEKGAAVAAAEYLQRTYPDVPGLSPRNLRRMRDFYRVYEGNPGLLDLTMEIGWTQNVVILESDLNMEERRWYLCAVRQLGWSKAELQRKIEAQAHLEIHLDESVDTCYTKCENSENEISCEDGRAETEISHQISSYQQLDNRKPGLTPCLTQAILSWYRLLRQTGHQLINCDYEQLDLLISLNSAILWMRLQRQDAPANGFYRPPK